MDAKQDITLVLVATPDGYHDHARLVWNAGIHHSFPPSFPLIPGGKHDIYTKPIRQTWAAASTAIAPDANVLKINIYVRLTHEFSILVWKSDSSAPSEASTLPLSATDVASLAWKSTITP